MPESSEKHSTFFSCLNLEFLHCLIFLQALDITRNPLARRAKSSLAIRAIVIHKQIRGERQLLAIMKVVFRHPCGRLDEKRRPVEASSETAWSPTTASTKVFLQYTCHRRPAVLWFGTPVALKSWKLAFAARVLMLTSMLLFAVARRSYIGALQRKSSCLRPLGLSKSVAAVDD